MMTLKVNAARGEVHARVGDVDVVLCADMERLAVLSSRLECRTFQDLFQRLVGAEPAAIMAAVEILTIKGDGIAARKAMTVRHVFDVAAKIREAVAAHMKDDEEPEGNAAAAGEAKSG